MRLIRRGIAHDRRFNPWLPLLLAFAGFAIDVAAYWPGQMSFDSAYAWWQARGGVSTDIVPPIFVWMWRLCDVFIDGPQLPFVLHLALFWSGLALLARAMRLGALYSALMMLLIAFTPLPWVLRGHVWTDVGLFSTLTFACGALALAEHGRRRWLLPAVATLAYAALLRHNALPAIVPLLAWAVWLALGAGRGRAKPAWSRVVLVTLLACATLIAANQLLERSVDRHVPVWTSLAQFDLAGVSVATGVLLLPDFMVGPGLDVADLGQAFRSWSNTPMLANTRHGMRDPFAENYTQDQLVRLRHAWMAAILNHPRAWIDLRWQVSRDLFGTHAPDWPVELIYVDDEIRYGDNPPVARNAGTLHTSLIRAASAWRSTPLLAAWPYLLAGLVGLPLAWRRREFPGARAALILLASAWMYALPLVLLAPSAELRYLGWPCVASLVALAFAIAASCAATADKLDTPFAEAY